MAKNRQKNAKKKARYRQQRGTPEPKRFVAESAPVEDLRLRQVKRVLSGVGVRLDGLGPLDNKRERLGLTWNGLIDHLVMKHAPECMVRAVESYLDLSDLGLRVRSSEAAVYLQRGGADGAVIYPTHARVLGANSGGWINANFTADGTHWSTLRAGLLGQPVATSTVRPSAEPVVDPDLARVVIAFPSVMEEGFRAEALTASRRIRTERTLDYGAHPVVLEAGYFAVRFEPIERRGEVIKLPFSLIEHGRSAISGALRLGGQSDPLAFSCSADLDDASIALAWGTGLIGFAALTCVDMAERIDGFQGWKGARQRRHGGASPDHRVVSEGRATYPSSALHPIGDASIAAPVAGHRRRLLGSTQASQEARAAAAEIGIALGPNETWVRPHVRGAIEDAELRFRWAPSETILAA